MGKLKFRVWNGDYFEYSDFNFKTGNLGCNFSSYANRNIPQQYTGYKDLNGVEIYEGDILGGVIGGTVKWCPVSLTYAFDFAGECSCFRCSGECILSEFNSELEVIGNVYQNKDLLEEL